MKTTIDKDFFKKWKNKDVAMHCKTEEQAKAFCKIMHENGLKWNDGDNYTNETLWTLYKKDSCYLFNEGCIQPIEECEGYGIVLEFEDYILEEGNEKIDIHEQIHKEIILMLHDIYKAKNTDYGNSFAKTRELYPNAILIRLTDKLERLKTLYEQESMVKNESIDDTLMDLANYAIMELIERRLDNERE